MKKENVSPTNVDMLRQKAEEFLTNVPAKSISRLSEAEILRLIHELEVHKVELEMQNEELSSAVLAAKDVTDLYDFAPTGYFTLSRSGEIKMLNLRGASMLGKDRVHLVNTMFSIFIADDAKPVFAQFFERVFNTNTKEKCDLVLKDKNSQIQYVQLSGIASENGEQCLVTMVDISDRKRAENELLRERWRLESIIESTHLGTWEWNVQSGETIFNEQWAQMIGYSLSELGPINISIWQKYTHPDDLKQSVMLLHSHFAGKLPYYDFECRMKHKAGHWVWVHDRGQVITWTEDGKPLMMFGTHTDITERKQAEQLLKESELKYRELIENSPDAIGIYVDGKIALVNHAGIDLMAAASADELIGKHVLDFVHSDFVNIAMERMGKSIETGTVAPLFEEKFIRLDGTIVDVEVKAMPIRFENQPAMQLVARDITKRKQTEEELKNSELNFRELFESNTDGIAIFSTSTEGTPSNILDMNENAARMVGYTKNEMKLLAPYHFEKDISPVKLEKRMHELLTNGCSNFETILKHKDGHELDVEIKIMPVNYYNQPALMNIVRDITDRKNNEIQLRQYAIELSKQIAEKDKFFSIIAHDLRGPFNGFLELTEFMAEGSNTLSMDDVHKIAAVMKKSAANLFRLLGNLLDWSRLQRGITQFYPIPIALSAKIHDIIALAKEAAAKKSIDVSILIPSDLVVFADENMLEAILRNLAGNAVKYTDKGGCVTVSATYLSGNSVEFAVKDTGIGMSKNTLDNLFNINVNTNLNGTAGELSTGLGLMICKDFIERHNGNLRIESEPGKGSTFYFSLPGQSEVENIATASRFIPTEKQPDESRKINILIAEDEETSDLLMSMSFTKISNEIFHAKTGVEAVDIIRRHPSIDLIMMDIQMPEMDGYEATRRIRQFNKDVVIIAQTAYTYSNERAMSLEAGCDDYISKPVNQMELMELIRKHIK